MGINEKGEEHPILLMDNEKVWKYPNFGISHHNGADTHSPSSMEFPTSGLWQLKVYFGDNLFDQIVVNVEEN